MRGMYVIIIHTFNFYTSIPPPPIFAGIPSALRQSGFLFGVILLLLVAVITDYTVLLLIKVGFLAKKFTYQVQLGKNMPRLVYFPDSRAHCYIEIRFVALRAFVHRTVNPP